MDPLKKDPADAEDTTITTTEDKPAEQVNDSLESALREGLALEKADETPTVVADPEVKLDDKGQPIVEAKTDVPPDTLAKPEADTAKLLDPGDMKGRTRERFVELGEKYKAVETERETFKAERDEAIGKIEALGETVRATGASPEEFGQTLNLLALSHSSVPEDLEQALAMLDRARETLSIKLGKPVAGIDLLAGQQDLLDAIEAGDMTRKHAEELAVLRRGKQREVEAVETVNRSAEKVDAELDAGKRQVDLVDSALKSTDPDYAEKIKALGSTLETIAKTKPPGEWAEAYRTAYAAVKLPEKKPAPTQGLRSSVTTSSNKSEPKTLFDALNQGLRGNAA